MSPIRVFIGTETKTEIARRVLECSIRRRTDAAVEFTPMIGTEWEYSLTGITVGTGFSLRRWMIPAFCNYQGRAIYCDADQICLDDIEKLWTAPFGYAPATICCTYDNDKYNPKIPAPQTSVMVIDCARAKNQWTFDLPQILTWLKANPGRENYADLMHAKFVDSVQRIDTRWNRLNQWVEGDMGILHYTKEDEQPWFKPDHPLAGKWRQELNVAMTMQFVTPLMITEALARWGQQDDWRKSNGLHPDYRSFAHPSQRVKPVVIAPPVKRAPKLVKPTPRVKTAPVATLIRDHNVLWVTTINPTIWRVSGEALLESFLATKTSGQFVIGFEEAVPPLPHRGDGPSPIYTDLTKSALLKTWLNANVDIMPAAYGGKLAEPCCACVGGPFDPRSGKHKQPCPGSWHNRIASQRFRKIAALRYVQQTLLVPGHRYKSMIWIDADCTFKHRVTDGAVESWFRGRSDCFYFKNKRATPELGLFGLSLQRNGLKLLQVLSKRYESGAFRKDPRWDDSFQFMVALKQSGVIGVDLSIGLGNHERAIPSSPAGHYIQHEEGRHSLKLKLP